jgi:trehalose-6-phosphatase
MNIFKKIWRRYFSEKATLQICDKCRSELLKKVSKEYRNYYEKKGILLKLCYARLEENIRKTMINIINSSFSKKEKRIASSNNCIYCIGVFSTQLKEIELKVIKEIIKKD